MKISETAWKNYIYKLRKINEKAGQKVAEYMAGLDINTAEGMKKLLDYSYAVATQYGEGATELACQMYDLVAESSKVMVPAAEPATTATYDEVVRAVKGKMIDTQDPFAVGSSIGRLVKMAGVDTTIKNALRDGAEWAWIPSGDTCSFCLTLASNGWKKASKNAIRNGHASHIHNNCDCTYAVRFDGMSEVEGYNPDELYEQYMVAEGDTPQEKINSLRRKHYAANKEAINAQKRAAYAKRKERERYFGKTKSIIIDEAEIYSQDYRKKFAKITNKEKINDKICDNARKILKRNSGTYREDLVLIDADTGKHIFTINSGGKDNSVSYTAKALESIKEAHEKNKKILAIHNHPNSLPPTLDDGVSAFFHGYDLGIAVGHDGSVYTYTPSKGNFSNIICEKVHNDIAYQVETGANLEEVWYNLLEEFGVNISRR